MTHPRANESTEGPYGFQMDEESNHEAWLRVEVQKAVFDKHEPATILMALVLDEGLPFGQAQAAYRRVYGADANLQDAAEKESAR